MPQTSPMNWMLISLLMPFMMAMYLSNMTSFKTNTNSFMMNKQKTNYNIKWM